MAKNGQKFLSGLTEREIKNPRFDFLKPTHSLFGYFTQLVEAYSRVLVPKAEVLERYEAFAFNIKEISKAGEQRQMWND